MTITAREPTFADVLAAREFLSGHLRPTPLLHRDAVCAALGLDVWLKCESMLPTGAFKVRGGLNLVGRDPTAKAGVMAASTGNHGQSIYHSLQSRYNGRLFNQLTLGSSYTWSKALDTQSANGEFSRIDEHDKRANYGPANFDRRHIFNVNWVYELPRRESARGFLAGVLNDWQLSGGYRFESGQPYRVEWSIAGVGNRNITGSDTEPPRVVISAVSVLVLVPSVLVVRRLASPAIVPAVYALAALTSGALLLWPSLARSGGVLHFDEQEVRLRRREPVSTRWSTHVPHSRMRLISRSR